MIASEKSELLGDNWQERCRPRDNRPISVWIKENVILQPPMTRTGPFDISISRQLIGPLDALQDDRVREENVLAPTRDGKTLVGDGWSAWLTKNAPGPFRWVFQDEKAATDQEDNRTKPILRNVPGLAQFIPDRGELSNVAGMVFVIDGPALGNLQSRGYKYMILDEPWMWKQGMLEEAKARQKDFKKLENNKLLVISQGGFPDGDWDAQYNSGIINEWAVQCQGCQRYLVPIWFGQRDDRSKFGMIWDEKRDDRGYWDIPKVIPTVRFECFHCGFTHVDTTRLKSNWNLTGKYIAEDTDKSTTKLSHHWNAIISYSFADLADMYLSARNKLKTGSVTSLIKFYQKQMAIFCDETTIFSSKRSFKSERYEINSDWPEEDGRLMTIDQQQGNVFYVTVRQWSARARQTRRLFRGVVHGEKNLSEIQKAYAIPANWVLADSGFKPKGEGGMYGMCIRNEWIATKGVGTITGNTITEGFPHAVEIKKGEHIRVMRSYSELSYGDPETGVEDRANLIRFDSDQIADLLDGLIKTGFWIEPDDDGSPEEKEYRLEMSSEFKKPKIDKFSGREVMKRVCPSGRNHYYDCSKLQVLGAILMDWLPDPLDNRTASEKPKQKEAA